MATNVDVGTLAGRIELNDTATAVLTAIDAKIAALDGRFESLGKRVKETGESSHKAGGDFLNLGEQVSSMGKALVGAFSIEKAAEFAMKIADDAKALRNLSLETHVGVEELQVLTAATGDYGVNAEMLGRVIFQLNQRLTGGDENLASSLHSIGLSVDELKGRAPEEIFKRIVSSVGQIADPLRQSSAAADIFGPKLGGAMVAVAKNFDQATEEARKFNNILDKESVEAAAHFADAWERTKTNAQNVAATFVGPLLGAVADVTDGVQNQSTRWATLIGLFQNGLAPTALMVQGLKEIGKASKDVYLPDKPPIDPKMLFILTLAKDATKALTEEQKFYLQQLVDMNALTAKNAASLGVNAAQFAVYQEQAAKAKEEVKKLAEAQKEINAAGEGWRGTLAKIDPEIVVAVSHYLQAGVSQQALADKYKLTSAAIASVAESLKYEQEAQAEEAKNTTDLIRLRGEYAQTLASLGGDAYAEAQAATEAWRVNEHAKIEASIEDWKRQHQGMAPPAELFNQYAELDDMIEASARLRAEKAALANNESLKNNRESLQSRVEQEQAALDFMLSGQKTYTSEQVHEQEIRLRDAQEKSADWRGTLNADLQSIKNAADDTASHIWKLTPPITVLLQDLSKAQFESLGGERRLKEIEEYYRLHPGARPGGTGETGLGPNDEAGYRRLLQMQTEYEQLKQYSARHQNEPSGPAGEPPASVYPPGQETGGEPGGGGATTGGGGGGPRPAGGGPYPSSPITNIFHVNGTADDVANKIADIFMARLKQGQRFGRA